MALRQQFLKEEVKQPLVILGPKGPFEPPVHNDPGETFWSGHETTVFWTC